jgi:putative isomerase
VHLPSGFAVKLSAYSARLGRYNDFRAGDSVRLGAHTADADHVALTLSHAGTTIELAFAKPDASSVAGSVRTVATGEWALRFWLLLEIGFLDRPPQPPPPDRVSIVPGRDPYTDPPHVRAERFCAVTSERPTFSGVYDDLDALRGELEAFGYFYPHPPQPDGRFAVLRFSAQEQGAFTFAVAEAPDADAAGAQARETLERAHELVADGARRAATDRPAAQAIRDVVAWNTVWDGFNDRFFTALSRNWIFDKFGGWGVWLDDVLYHGLLAAAVGDRETAEANVAVALAGQQPAGNLPCLLTAYTKWVDRSQPPIAAYVVWRIHLLQRDRAFLERWYPVLRRAHLWWFEHRDGNGNGLLEYGSSPVGDGAFVHSKQGALNEAAMDNMPIFDDARFDPATHTLDFEEVGLNSLLVLEGQMLARIARELGLAEDAAEHEARAGRLAEIVRTELWDGERQVFAGRFWSGELTRRLSPTSFFPLVAGIPTREQADALVRRHLLNTDEFWGERPLPSTPYDDPASHDDVYWRGRVWPPLNFLTWEGLRRYGYRDEAAALAERSFRMFAEEWESDRHCHENFHLHDGARNDAPSSDSFYGWGALMPLMALLEERDVSPWDA